MQLMLGVDWDAKSIDKIVPFENQFQWLKKKSAPTKRCIDNKNMYVVQNIINRENDYERKVVIQATYDSGFYLSLHSKIYHTRLNF